jgi:hypothetical protein
MKAKFVCHSSTCLSVANSIETSLRKVHVAQFLSKYISELWSCLTEHAREVRRELMSIQCGFTECLMNHHLQKTCFL